MQHFASISSTTRSLSSTSSSAFSPDASLSLSQSPSNTQHSTELPLERIWTFDQDWWLWQNHRQHKSIVYLASILGRGIQQVQDRLVELEDVSSVAYQRLSVSLNAPNADDAARSKGKKKQNTRSIASIGEVLKRIEWDYDLQLEDFTVCYYQLGAVNDLDLGDKNDTPSIEETCLETSLSPLSSSTTLTQNGGRRISRDVCLLPDHLICRLKYKDRIVWDKSLSLDLILGPPGIYQIVESYNAWKSERDQESKQTTERRQMMIQHIQDLLGKVDFDAILKDLDEINKEHLGDITTDAAAALEPKVKAFVRMSSGLLQTARDKSVPADNEKRKLKKSSSHKSAIWALDTLSELILGIIESNDLRQMLLLEVNESIECTLRKHNSKQASGTRPLPVVLLDDDLTETFVRGSGPGGQKINKTSNRVVLVHKPTMLKVECQETRSLHQNRKIARKRLMEKLDEHLNGSQSKLGMKQQKAAMKRQKSKNKSRARLQKKQEEKVLLESIESMEQ